MKTKKQVEHFLRKRKYKSEIDQFLLQNRI